MKRESVLTLLLALLVVVALLQTFQLTGLKGKVTSNVVQDIEGQPPAPSAEQLPQEAAHNLSDNTG